MLTNVMKIMEAVIKNVLIREYFLLLNNVTTSTFSTNFKDADPKYFYRPGNFSCACNIGYELYSANGTAGFAIELSETGDRDGDTYQKNKSCVPVMCAPLSSPENGKLLSTKNAYHFGDIVQFQCDFGYVMSGFSSLLCTSSGNWNGTAPECQCKYSIYLGL